MRIFIRNNICILHVLISAHPQICILPRAVDKRTKFRFLSVRLKIAGNWQLQKTARDRKTQR